MRILQPVLAAAASAALVLSLSACGGPAPSASPSADASAAPSAVPTARASVAPVNSLDGITVKGDPGKDPQVDVPKPYAVDETRSKVLSAGSGPTVAENSYVSVHYKGVNGYTGETFDSSFSRGEPAVFSLEQVVMGFSKGLAGKKVGDRVLIAMPGSDGYDAQGGNPPAIMTGDTLVFVVDIIDINYDKAFGTPAAAKAGMPQVKEVSGLPTVMIPQGATPPAGTSSQTIITGGGNHKVGQQDIIMVKYRGYSWKTGKQLIDAYDKADTGNLSETLKCWQDAMPGQTLGSRLLVVCPPTTGYPEGSDNPPIEAGDTVVFVIDILFAAPGQ